MLQLHKPQRRVGLRGKPSMVLRGYGGCERSFSVGKERRFTAKRFSGEHREHGTREQYEEECNLAARQKDHKEVGANAYLPMDARNPTANSDSQVEDTTCYLQVNHKDVHLRHQLQASGKRNRCLLSLRERLCIRISQKQAYNGPRWKLLHEVELEQRLCCG